MARNQRTNTGTLPWLLTTLVLLSLFAGCVDDPAENPDDGTDGGEPDAVPPADAFMLTTTSMPDKATAGTAFTFNLAIEPADGFNEEHVTDHIGAHYADTSHDEGDLANYPAACDHQEGRMPGTYEITCTIDDPGTYYLRGHARISLGGAQVNYWSQETDIAVEEGTTETTPDFGDYTLTASDLPDTVAVGERFNFTLTIEGDTNDASDHIGAHYSDTTHDQGDLANYPFACEHQAGEAPGTFNVFCTFEDEGAFYLRGHMRLTKGEHQQSYWTDEHVIEAAPA